MYIPYTSYSTQNFVEVLVDLLHCLSLVVAILSLSFTVHPENKQLMLNDNLILNCTAVGSPKPRIQWLVNGTSKLGMENIFSATNNSTTVTSFLNITTTTVTHTGTYSCLATNSFYSNHSVVSNSATVTVHCKLII